MNEKPKSPLAIALAKLAEGPLISATRRVKTDFYGITQNRIAEALGQEPPYTYPPTKRERP